MYDHHRALMQTPRIATLALIAMLAGALGLGTACGGEDGGGPGDPSAADVKEEAGEALGTAGDYMVSEGREIARRAELALEGTKAEVMEAKRELAELPDEARAELEQAITRADEAGEDLGRELSELREAGADDLAEAEARLEAALDEVAEARREIAAALSGDDDDRKQAAS